MVLRSKFILAPSAVLSLLLAQSSIDVASAFVPCSSPSLVTHSVHQIPAKATGPKTRNQLAGIAPFPAAVAARDSSTTALSANLFDRIVRVAKGNVNNVLKYMEDPEKIMNQALEDMQTDLVKIRQSYAEITATQRRLLRQKEVAEQLAEDWHARAQLALRQDNEGLARQALAQRQVHLETVKGLQAQIDSQAGATDKLYDGMRELESRILEAKAKKEQMVARARTAKSTQQVNDMLTGITGKTSMDAFKRMEEKVEALEAAAEVSSEMKVFGLPEASTGKVEEEFHRLEASAEVDDELKRMKQNLLTGTTETTTNVHKIPLTVSVGIDAALEKLKEDAGI